MLIYKRRTQMSDEAETLQPLPKADIHKKVM